MITLVMTLKYLFTLYHCLAIPCCNRLANKYGGSGTDHSNFIYSTYIDLVPFKINTKDIEINKTLERIPPVRRMQFDPQTDK